MIRPTPRSTRTDTLFPYTTRFRSTTVEELDEQVARLSEGADYLIADTPCRDDVFARHLATSADTLVTPINDSFIDFDLLGQVEPEIGRASCRESVCQYV